MSDGLPMRCPCFNDDMVQINNTARLQFFPGLRRSVLKDYSFSKPCQEKMATGQYIYIYIYIYIYKHKHIYIKESSAW